MHLAILTEVQFPGPAHAGGSDEPPAKGNVPLVGYWVL